MLNKCTLNILLSLMIVFIFKIKKIVYKIKSIKTNYTSNCKKTSPLSITQPKTHHKI